MLHWKPSSTLLASKIFEILQKTLPNFHAEVDTKTRNEFISVVEDFCARLAASLLDSPKFSDQKRCSDRVALTAQDDSLKTTKDELPKFFAWFMAWYRAFLFNELRPTASYQRHVTALKVLRFIIARDLNPYHAQVSHGVYDFQETKSSTPRSRISARLCRLLLDLVLDPFDDVRDAAASLLDLIDQNASSSRLDIHSKHQTIEISRDGPNTPAQAWDIESRAESMMRSTGRADYADGVGRLHNRLYTSCIAVDNNLSYHEGRKSTVESILKKLGNDVAIAQSDIRRAVSNAPLHGYLIALR